MTPQYSPYLNCWLLLLSPSPAVFLQQSHEEAVGAGFCRVGSETLSERLQASFRPLRQQINQPEG